MHGFLNVFIGGGVCLVGREERGSGGEFKETDAAALRFENDGLEWRGHRLGTAQIRCARREFAHSFGSCSFEEPVSELRELELLP